MKKTSMIFIIACMTLCLIPSVGMLLFPTTQTTENKAMAAPPSLIAEGKVNTDFFRDFEKYFNEVVWRITEWKKYGLTGSSNCRALPRLVLRMEKMYMIKSAMNASVKLLRK